MPVRKSQLHVNTCPRCGAIAIPARTSCHMCYAVLLPLSIETAPIPEIKPYIPSDPVAEPDTKLSDLPALAVMLDEPIDIGEPSYENLIDTSSTQFVDVLPTSPVVVDLPDPCQPDIAPTDVGQQDSETNGIEPPVDAIVDEPIQKASTPVSPSVAPIDDLLPEFLRYGSVKKHRLNRKTTRTRLRGILRRITGWVLVFVVMVLAYTAWRHTPMITSDQQTATNTAARLALAINDRDYDLLYNSTIWTDHYKQAFHNSADIDRF